MPYTTAVISVAEAYTTILWPAASTMPVLSTTPLDNNDASYSMYSALVGVAEVATAIRMSLAVVEFLLHRLTVTTANIDAGQV